MTDLRTLGIVGGMIAAAVVATNTLGAVSTSTGIVDMEAVIAPSGKSATYLWLRRSDGMVRLCAGGLAGLAAGVSKPIWVINCDDWKDLSQ